MAPAKPKKDEPGKEDDDLEVMTYEELVAELESLTGKMSSNDVGIEEATSLYERAAAVHKVASLKLDTIRERIEKLEQEK